MSWLKQVWAMGSLDPASVVWRRKEGRGRGLHLLGRDGGIGGDHFGDLEVHLLHAAGGDAVGAGGEEQESLLVPQRQLQHQLPKVPQVPTPSVLCFNTRSPGWAQITEWSCPGF